MELEKPSEFAVIFSEEKVRLGEREISVKPWTLRQLTAVWPHVLQPFQDEANNLRRKLGKGPEEEISFVDLFFKDPTLLADVYLPHSVKILSISLNRKDQQISDEEIEDLDAGIAIALIFQVFALNLSHLKNLQSLLLGSAETMAKAMLKTPSQGS